jgi:tetrahydromethanopterin S-methyltransferase subunit D
MYTVLLPSTIEGIVPVKLPAVRDVRAVPDPEKPVADKTPVLGTNDILLVEIFAAELPAAVVHNGYTAVAVATSSVELTGTVIAAEPSKLTPLIALAVVNVAAEPSILVIPISACGPDVLFNVIAVDPTYTVLLPSTIEGIVPVKLPAVRDVRDAPDPEKPVADRTPVLGTNEILLVEIFAAVLPAAVVHNGYTDVAVATSSVELTGTVMFAEPSKLTPLIALAVVNVAAEPSMLVMPVNTNAAVVLFNAIAVVPM